MRIRWRGLELPTKVEPDKSVSTDTYGKFVVEPFERGFGTTVGNSLRRILLSSLEGSAAISIKINGVDHEFAQLDGIVEDVTDIILNVKALIISMDGDEPKVLSVSKKGPAVVTGADLVGDASLVIHNKQQVIATITTATTFTLELEIHKGRGFVTALENTQELEARSDGQIIGVIPIDSVYSPVIRVRYKTEDTRVGQKTNYDRLIMEIWTNGTISPEMALVEAAKILRKHLNAFVQHFEPGDSLDAELNVEFQPAAPALNEALSAKLNQPISVLDLSVRASNCLESAKIHTIGELLKLSENDLLKVRSFGKTSLREVKRKLQDIGLTLGLSPDATFGGSEPKTRVVHSEDGLTVTIFLEDGRICVDGLDMPENAAIRSGMGSIGGKKTIYIDVLKSANDSVNQWTAKSLDRKVIRVSNVSDLEVGPHPWGNFDRDNVAHIDIPKLFR